MKQWIFIIIVAVLACSCAGDTSSASDPVKLVPGKSDDGSAVTEPVAFDPDDPRWELVEACTGFDLCLDVLVAGRDRSDFESERFAYPMQRVLDELFSATDLRISPNCDGRLGFDANMNVGCAPEDDEPFLFGMAAQEMDGSDSTWRWVEYDYAGLSRARLFRDVEADIHYLDLR